MDEIRGGGGGVALRSAGGALCYPELFEHVRRLGERLMRGGLVAGDRVLLVAPNSPDLVVGLLGVLAAGGVAVPVSADSSARRFKRVAALTGARLSLVHRDCRVPTPLPGAREFALAHDLTTLQLGPAPKLEPAADSAVPADTEAALILLSSGSTGEPKGVVLRHAGLVWTARTLAERFGLGPNHVELIVCPLVHSGAWQRVAATLWAGGTVVISAGTLSIAALLDDGAAFGVRGFYAPPPLIRYLLKTDPRRVREALASLRTVEIGSAPMSGDELRGLLDLLPDARVYTHYGLTECSRACVLDAAAHPQRLGTVGRPLPGVEVSIRGPDGSPAGVAPGTAGEIWLRGPQAAAAYWRQSELSNATFVDGWVRTGDHGRLETDGFLVFLGRRDDRITSAGFSFYPAEVEAELGIVPGVRDYLIAGVPDPRGVLGQIACAFVVPEDPETWSAVEWSAAARRRLPAHMVPRKVVPVDELPRSPSGKSDRRRAVELYAGGKDGE